MAMAARVLGSLVAMPCDGKGPSIFIESYSACCSMYGSRRTIQLTPVGTTRVSPHASSGISMGNVPHSLS